MMTNNDYVRMAAVNEIHRSIDKLFIGASSKRLNRLIGLIDALSEFINTEHSRSLASECSELEYIFRSFKLVDSDYMDYDLSLFGINIFSKRMSYRPLRLDRAEIKKEIKVFNWFKFVRTKQVQSFERLHIFNDELARLILLVNKSI